MDYRVFIGVISVSSSHVCQGHSRLGRLLEPSAVRGLGFRVLGFEGLGF